MTVQIGQVIKGYTIKSIVGSGGQSVAYLASHAKYDKDVVVRGTLPEYADDPDLLQRFQAEALIFSRLKHTHIVPFLDYWRDESGPWLVQSYMVGGSLRDKLNTKEPLSLSQIGKMLDTVGDALDYTHSHNIIHRDIKPDNILYDESDIAFVHDFGVAKRLDSDAITRADVMIGSPAYYSPEQITKHPITPQTDIYIMGITLFEAITGKHPYEDTHTSMQLIVKHLQSPLPPVKSLRANVPDEIDKVLAIATAKDASNRYPSMQAFLDAFRQAIGTEE